MSLKSRQKGFGRIYQAVVATLLLNFIFIGVGIAQTYNLANDFSTKNNPNGVWSYGGSASRGGSFYLYNQLMDDYGLQKMYHDTSLSLEPSIYYNPTDQTIYAYTWLLSAHKVNFHPGPGGENSVIRWTAPMSGNIQIDAVFIGGNPVYPTTTDVAILYGSTELLSSNIDSYNIPIPFSKNFTVKEGETVDFTVGYGSNGNYHGDSTGIDITISYSVLTITASSGTGGTINPSGSVSVNSGESRTFSVAPKVCYDIDKVLVNGSAVTLTNGQYTFTNVTANQTVSATFKQNPCCTDSDNDGIPDLWDKCPATPAGSIVDSTGCPVTVYTQAQLDQRIADAKASMYTQTQLDAAKQESFQKGIQSCKDNPADCALFTEAQLKQAVKDEQLKWDANGDGRIGLEDIIYMLQVIAGLRP